MPKVSIIIPNYQRADLLREALQSIREQSLPDWEAIVVDNAAEDGGASRRTVEAFDEARFNYLPITENRGPAAARNAALPLCTGEYLAFLDNDDLFRPRKLEIQCRLLDQHPEAAMIYSDEFTLDGNGISAKTVWAERVLPSGSIAAAFFQESFVAMMTVLIRRQVFEEFGGFDETLAWNEDDDLWLRVMLRYPVLCSDYPSGIRRLHEKNMSRDRGKMTLFQFRAIQKLLDHSPGFIRDHASAALKRIDAVLKAYLHHQLMHWRLPHPEVLSAYRETRLQLRALK